MITKEKDMATDNCSMENSPRQLDKSSGRKSNPGLSFLLKELEDEENFTLVCHALFHEDLEISIGASLVLGYQRDARSLPYLLRAFLTKEQKRAEALVWALGEIKDESAVPFLLAALSAGFVSKSVILALGKIGSLEAMDAILGSLNDRDETIRLLATKALGQLSYDSDTTKATKVCFALKARLAHEASRRVKLLLAATSGRLIRMIEQQNYV